MKKIYGRFIVVLVSSFTLGLAIVYIWNGISIGMGEIPVDLPKIDSKDEVLLVDPSTAHDSSPPNIPREGEIIDGRNLSHYDNGGYIESCDQVEKHEWTSCLRKREAARRFVFDHWTAKRRGYIQVGHPCIDCSPVDHIFIEPDSNGKFRIVVTLETIGPLRTEKASKVIFRQANKDEQRRSDATTVLSFVDRKGNEIDHF
jgi:hypothetical protein